MDAVPGAPLSFAEADGTGSHACADVGFAGSSGGAFRLFFGTEDAGCEWRTSLWNIKSIPMINQNRAVCAYPADIGVQESPPDSILPNLLHPSTPIQKDGQHPFTQIYDRGVLLRLGRFRSIIRHCMFLWDGRHDEGRVKVYESLAQRREFGISSSDL